MIKKQLFYLFYIFLQFYLTSLRGKEYFAKLTNSQEPELGVFGSLEPEPEPFEKKNKEPEPLGGEKSGAGAAWKKSQEPEPKKKICRFQPWLNIHYLSFDKSHDVGYAKVIVVVMEVIWGHVFGHGEVKWPQLV